MKPMFREVAAVSAAVIIITASAVSAAYKSGALYAQYIESQTRQYPATGVVTELDKSNDSVVFETFSGNRFAFYGIEDWKIGDIVSAIMDDSGTPEITDDSIISVRYSGYVK